MNTQTHRIILNHKTQTPTTNTRNRNRTRPNPSAATSTHLQPPSTTANGDHRPEKPPTSDQQAASSKHVCLATAPGGHWGADEVRAPDEGGPSPPPAARAPALSSSGACHRLWPGSGDGRGAGQGLVVENRPGSWPVPERGTMSGSGVGWLSRSLAFSVRVEQREMTVWGFGGRFNWKVGRDGFFIRVGVVEIGSLLSLIMFEFLLYKWKWSVYEFSWWGLSQMHSNIYERQKFISLHKIF